MKVINREGNVEPMDISLIQRKIQTLAHCEPKLDINVIELTICVIDNIHDEITTSELDNYTIAVCHEIVKYTPTKNDILTSTDSDKLQKIKLDYKKLANRLLADDMSKYTEDDFIINIQKALTRNLNLDIRHMMKKIIKSSKIDYYVIKRDGNRELVDIQKIQQRIENLIFDKEIGDPLTTVDSCKVTIKVVKELFDGITTSQLDQIASKTAFNFAKHDREYDHLAKRLAISNLHKNTVDSFSQMMKTLYTDDRISKEIYQLVDQNKEQIDSFIDYSRDYLFDYFGIHSLQNTYLIVNNGQVIERPQHMYMRCAIEIHRSNMDKVKETYDMLSLHYAIHATPTLFNSCLKNNQLSSCMLLTNDDDSVEGIFETIKDCAILGSKSGGIGLSVNNIRASGSIIRSSGRPSDGVPSFLTIHDKVSTVIDQGRKRPMSIAMYIEPWHADFIEFLEMRAVDNTTKLQGRHLFYAVWSNNLLMERAENNELWSFFCPIDAPKLQNTYGDEFKKHYLEYENAKLYRKQMPAREVYCLIAKQMKEHGRIYHLNKDACNEKSNLKNVGHLNCSNLCCEILIPSGRINGEKEIGVCTLASINLTKFVTPAVFNNQGVIISNGKYDFDQLGKYVQILVENLNNVIDVQMYPVEAGKRSSMRHRPIGIGVQGLANVFMAMGYPYTSKPAKELNQHISEVIYYHSLKKSMELAERDGSYETFAGSPASQGILQPHLWKDQPSEIAYKYSWDEIGEEVKRRGLRNSILTAYMPTAGTSQLLGNYSSFEPAVSNLYARHTQAGNFIVRNYQLIKLLEQLNLWDDQMYNDIINAEGSIQGITSIPQSIRDIYKTVWELKVKDQIDMCADRGRFICQTQSFNVHIENATVSKITSVIAYGMKKGLKTIAYYTRSRSALTPVKVTTGNTLNTTVNKDNKLNSKTKDDNKSPKKYECTDEVCVSCQS